MSASTGTPVRSAGSWARDLAKQYDQIAAQFEKFPDDERSRLGAVLNRGEAAKYHQIAADMDAAFPNGAPIVVPPQAPHDDPPADDAA